MSVAWELITFIVALSGRRLHAIKPAYDRCRPTVQITVAGRKLGEMPALMSACLRVNYARDD